MKTATKKKVSFLLVPKAQKSILNSKSLSAQMKSWIHSVFNLCTSETISFPPPAPTPPRYPTAKTVKWNLTRPFFFFFLLRRRKKTETHHKKLITPPPCPTHFHKISLGKKEKKIHLKVKWWRCLWRSRRQTRIKAEVLYGWGPD